MKLFKNKLILVVVLLLLSPVVIGEFKFRSLIYPLLWVSIPIFSTSVLLKKRSVTRATLFTLLLIVYTLISMILLLRFTMCGDGEKRYLYVNKRNDNIKIVGRDFSCLGTLGDLVLYKEFSVSKNVKLEIQYKTFIEYKNIDIDTNVWKPIHEF